MLEVPKGRAFLCKAFLSLCFSFFFSEMFWYTLAKCLGGWAPRKPLSVCTSFKMESMCFEKKQSPGKGPVRVGASDCE